MRECPTDSLLTYDMLRVKHFSAIHCFFRVCSALHPKMRFIFCKERQAVSLSPEKSGSRSLYQSRQGGSGVACVEANIFLVEDLMSGKFVSNRIM